ncbi:unnamed protein product, partial [Vitis vinifera]|uniref:Uncharacterized protein n=1 Tax=Vitis vinifera TaxID=29760 RepID=D7TRF8_VITVI
MCLLVSSLLFLIHPFTTVKLLTPTNLHIKYQCSTSFLFGGSCFLVFKYSDLEPSVLFGENGIFFLGFWFVVCLGKLKIFPK